MSTLAQPPPQRTYVFVANKAAVGDQVNKELDTLYNTLQGGLGDVHIASNANINGQKIAVGSIPSAALSDPGLQSGYGFVPIGGVIDYDSDGSGVPVGFEIADGHTCTDSLSARYSGKSVPNCISKFRRGVSLQNTMGSVVGGGADAHTHSISTDLNGWVLNSLHHVHSYSGGNTSSEVGSGDGDGSNGNGFITLGGAPGVQPHNQLGHAHGGATGGTSNVPSWIGLVPIVRVK